MSNDLKSGSESIVLVEDERLAMLKQKVGAHLRSIGLAHLEILTFSTGADAEKFLTSAKVKHVAVVVFDSAFGKELFLGCHVYKAALKVNPELRARTVFFTAYGSEVRAELGKGKLLMAERVISKSRHGTGRLLAVLDEILAMRTSGS